MTFVTKWLQFEHSRERERRCNTKSEAESVAFHRIDEQCKDVWIEDEHGKIVVANEELRRRRTLEGSR
jgi:hypothetical protein